MKWVKGGTIGNWFNEIFLYKHYLQTYAKHHDSGLYETNRFTTKDNAKLTVLAPVKPTELCAKIYVSSRFYSKVFVASNKRNLTIDGDHQIFTIQCDHECSKSRKRSSKKLQGTKMEIPKQ